MPYQSQPLSCGHIARLNFLKEIREQLATDGILILGFCFRQPDALYFMIVHAIASPLRRPPYRELIEKGDKLEPALEHHFTIDEINKEAQAAGFIGWTKPMAIPEGH